MVISVSSLKPEVCIYVNSNVHLSNFKKENISNYDVTESTSYKFGDFVKPGVNIAIGFSEIQILYAYY